MSKRNAYVDITEQLLDDMAQVLKCVQLKEKVSEPCQNNITKVLEAYGLHKELLRK